MSKKIPLQDLHYNLNAWISKTLSIPNPIFNNMPACPYAKKAWTEDKVEVCAFDSWVDAYSFLVTKEWNFPEVEVVIISFPPEGITPDMLSLTLDKLTDSWKHDHLVILEDHPDEVEEVKEFNLNFKEAALLLVQPRSKLNEARAYLESKGYYKNWTKDYKNSVQAR